MKFYYQSFLLFLVLGIASCTKDENLIPETVTKANIIGSVNLYDESTTHKDNSGMIVSIAETTPVISATTDIDGNFTLTDVPFGKYTLVYTKTGFGTYKKLDIEHINTGKSTIIYNTPSLGESSSTQITNLDTKIEANNIVLSITTTPAGNNGNIKYIRYFLSPKSNVSNINYTYFSAGLISKINPKEVVLTAKILSDAGFSSGETIFVKVYGDSFWSNQYENLQRMIFPNLNPNTAEAVSFIVP